MSTAQTLGPWTVQKFAGGRSVQTDRARAWEELGFAKDDSGPFRYLTSLPLVIVGDHERVLLRFGAVSYACVVDVDGVEVGRHTGLWDSFEIDVTDAVRDPGGHTLGVTVEKPASLTAGPDSAHVAGRYATREVLAGFLPYVWGRIHGGIWQPVELVVVSQTRVTGLDVWGDPDGLVSAVVATSRPARGRIDLCDPNGVPMGSHPFDTTAGGTVHIRVAAARPWSVDDPALYTVSVYLDDGTDPPVVRRLGLRRLEVRTEGRTSGLRLNGEPLYPRMILSWGWYPDRLAPDPGPERVRADLETLRQMGFNGVKLCLWFPPDYYFEIADELGMLLWVELPMWLPRPTPGFADQLQAETTALVEAARQHPSVIIYTLGCELSSAVDATVLGPLYRQVKELTRDAIVCDNSGSGEAYGGAADAFRDFYDHHLYCELEHLGETFDYFAPGWRAPMPWLFGEFCDLDTFRDLRVLGAGTDQAPWWLSGAAETNSQGARWQFDVPFMEDRLRAGGWWERGEELDRISRNAAELHRKVTLETVRLRSDTSGYVITTERDTPISTSGLIDDLGSPKFDPQQFATFNSDTVLLIAPERRRRWEAGGDRPAPPDPWCHPAGSQARLHLLVAHHHAPTRLERASWTLTTAAGHVGGAGQIPAQRLAVGVQQIGVADLALPVESGPVELRIRGEVSGQTVSNSWTLWVVPADPWQGLAAITVDDPADRFRGLPAALQSGGRQLPKAPLDVPVLAARWSDGLAAFVRDGGGRALIALDRQSGGPVPLVAEPFWRESLKVIEPHPWWDGFPHTGTVGLQFLGCATDLSMDTSGLADLPDIQTVDPLLRRLDARTGITHDYAVSAEWGSGKLLLTSLRFEGGRGSQPVGLARNVGAQALLATWLQGLSPAS
ncbi:hypothetical protein GCM10009841_21140 [Microlunatus panaciterrae]|uniref:Glycosyl hydrolases family 2 n=1 Tax=Microlunatus panaciterrae TaxID=400768 RepID=A0ABS2RPZ4_9ACTN|nr:hypothetical protein [Microlunatus panaciterrae]MBM7800667.1 hypothetical protein [Microlunatus panaciterrae]